MKTIFITSFHQHISRNILLTDFFELLKKTQNLKIVVIVPNFKVEYFKKNFQDENVIIEGVELYRASKKFNGLLFKRLSRTFFDTGTTRGKRRYKYYWDKKFIYFLTSEFISFFGRFFIMQSFVRWLDYKFSPREFFNSLIEKYKPEIIFSTDIHNENDVALMQDARRSGIKILGMWRSWDNPTQQMLRIFPDILICGSNRLMEESILLHNFPRNKIIVTGHPHHDRYIKAPLIQREEFFKKFKMDILKPFILFAPGGDKIIHDNDVDLFVLKILNDLGFQILVRYPPGEDVQLIDKEKWSSRIVFDKPGFRFSGRPDFEITKKDDENLIDQIYFSSLIVTGPTSIPLDAALLDRPVIITNLYPTERNKYEKGWGFLLDHIHNLLDTKGAWYVRSKEELIEAVEAYIKDASIHADGRRKIKKIWLTHADGMAGSRLYKVIKSNL